MKLLKNIQKTLILAAIALSTLSSCDANDPPPPAQPTSYFTTGGTTYELAAGAIDTSGNPFIVLHSASVSLNSNLDGFVGIGDGCGFSVYGSTIGTFTYGLLGNSGDFNDLEYMLNSDSSDQSINGTAVTGGTITIANGSAAGTYIIDINATGFVLHYEGTLTAATLD